MINVEQTIISQYGNSATITQLVRNMNEYVDPRADLDAFFSFVWNVDSARGFGLDIWGRIVNIRRELLIPETLEYFGFNEAVGSGQPFEQAPFYDGTPPATQTLRLADDAYRALIYIKALRNISSTNPLSINTLLRNLFTTSRTSTEISYTPLGEFVLGESVMGYLYAETTVDAGRCYVSDLGDMSMRYTFEFELTPYEFAVITQSGALPRPAGVSATIFQSALPLFGFSEAGESACPFGQGVFVSEGATHAAN